MNESEKSMSRAHPVGINTTVTLGLIILLGGGLISTIWVASALVTKMDSRLYAIETVLVSMQSANKANWEQVLDLEKRMTKIETVGPPALQQLQKDVSELLRQFELHRIREGKP